MDYRLRFILVSNLWFASILVLAAALSWYLPGPGIIGAVVLLIVWGSSFWFSGKLGRDINFWIILFSGISGFSLQYHFSDWYLLTRGGTARVRTVSELSQHPTTAAFEIASAVVRPNFSGSDSMWYKSSAGGTDSTHFHAAPLTDTYWSPGQPVHAWVVEKTGYPSISFGIDTTVCALIPASRWFESSFRSAVANARRLHSLDEAVEARLFMAVDSIQEAKQSKQRLVLLLILGPWVFMNFCAFLGLVSGQFTGSSTT